MLHCRTRPAGPTTSSRVRPLVAALRLLAVWPAAGGLPGPNPPDSQTAGGPDQVHAPSATVGAALPVEGAWLLALEDEQWAGRQSTMGGDKAAAQGAAWLGGWIADRTPAPQQS